MKKFIILLAVSIQSIVLASYHYSEDQTKTSESIIRSTDTFPDLYASSIYYFSSHYYANVYSSGTEEVAFSGGSYPNMSIASQGVTGLTATTKAGTGNTITFTVSGYASEKGEAHFFTVVNSQVIQFKVTVQESLSRAWVASLDCSSINATGYFSANTPSVGSKDILYTGGNGLAYFPQKIISTGVQGLTATLNAGTLNYGDSVPGKLNFKITGIPSSAGKAYFTVVFGGQNCAFSVDVNDAAGRVLALNCGASEASGTFSAGKNSNGTKVVEYISGNGQPYAAQVVQSTGVTGLTAVLTAGVLNSGNGSVSYQILGVPASSGIAYFEARIGDKSCIFSVDVGTLPTITNLNCNGRLSGTYKKGVYTSNGAKTVSYQSSNKGTYKAITIASTGVTGLTATADAGQLNNGSGNITFKITGTPQSSGIATFTVNLGNQSCSFTVRVEDEILNANCYSGEDFGYNISENPNAPTTLMIGGEQVKVYRRTTNRSRYPSCYGGWGQTQSGVTMDNTCARFRMGYYYVNSMTLVFDKPVNNIGFKSTWYANNDSAIITTNGGGTLEMKGVIGDTSLITNNTGNFLRTAGNTNSRDRAGIAYIISSTQPYTELTLTYDTRNNDIIAVFNKCSARVEDNIGFSKSQLSKEKVQSTERNTSVTKALPALKLYPNPAKNLLKVSQIKGQASYQIFTLGGRPIDSGTVSENTSIDVSKLQKGVYMIIVEDPEGKHSGKFLKD